MITYTDSTTKETEALIGVYGETGATGATGNGISSITYTYATSTTQSGTKTTYQSSIPTLSDTNKYLWQKETINYTSGSPKVTEALIGVYGDKGATGDTGNGISSITYTYATSTTQSGTKTTYQASIPTLSETNKYLWQKEVITYTNGSTKETEALIGVYGDKGLKGDTGDTGNGISSITYYYAVSATQTQPSSVTSTTIPTLSPTDKYLWQREYILYTNGTNKDTTALIGVYGNTGATGATGNGISTITYYYATSTTQTEPSSVTLTTIPALDSTNRYLWQKEVIAYTDGTDKTTVALIGVYGDTGAQGIQGYSIVASVSRTAFTEAQWTTYGTIGHEEPWSNTSTSRGGCRVGDIFTVVGTATDTGNGHVAYYRSTTASGNLQGACIAHSISNSGEDGVNGKFLGAYSSAPSGNSGDWYVNTTNGITYTYDGSSWSASTALGQCLDGMKALQDSGIDLSTVSDTNTVSYFKTIIAEDVLVDSIKGNSALFDSISVTGNSTFSGYITNPYFQVTKPQSSSITYSGTLGDTTATELTRSESTIGTSLYFDVPYTQVSTTNAWTNASDIFGSSAISSKKITSGSITFYNESQTLQTMNVAGYYVTYVPSQFLLFTDANGEKLYKWTWVKWYAKGTDSPRYVCIRDDTPLVAVGSSWIHYYVLGGLYQVSLTISASSIACASRGIEPLDARDTLGQSSNPWANMYVNDITLGNWTISSSNSGLLVFNYSGS